MLPPLCVCSVLILSCFWTTAQAGSSAVERLVAATHFGEVGDNNNHIIVYIGGESGAQSFVEDIQRALGISTGPPPCLDLQGADVQLQFQGILQANYRQRDEYTLVVALGTETAVSSADSSGSADMARVLDFLYLVSDKSSVHRNVVVLVAWQLEDVPAGASSELAEQHLMSALQPLASDTFNPASFLGRVLSVHVGDPRAGESPSPHLCSDATAPAGALYVFVMWLGFSCIVAFMCYTYIVCSIVAGGSACSPAEEAVEPVQAHHRVDPFAKGRIAPATHSHDTMDPTHHRYSSSEDEGPVSSVRLRQRQSDRRGGAGPPVESSVRSRRNRTSKHRTI